MSKEAETTYIVDISSVYGVDEKTADEIKERGDAENQAWLIDQVKKGFVHVVDIIEEGGLEHTGVYPLGGLEHTGEEIA